MKLILVLPQNFYPKKSLKDYEIIKLNFSQTTKYSILKSLQYWNKCKIKKLALKGVILRRLVKIKKITLYTTCVFTKAHKRVWYTSKSHKSIRKEEENKVGDGTSVHYIIFY